MKRDSNKREEKPCECDVHLRNEAGSEKAIPCLGHGEGCPCTEKLKNENVSTDTSSKIE
jgi:hypothetical protein